MTILARIRQQLLAEGRDDYVGLWELAWTIRRSRPDPTSDEVRELALAVLRPLLHDELMAPGTLQDCGGFLPWGCSSDVALARIDEEWRALGHDPSIGQVCWFSNTPAGDNMAGED